MKTRIAHVKAKVDSLLDLRLEGEIDKGTYSEKKAALDGEQAKLTHRLNQVTLLVTQAEDDLDRALAVANQLPMLWAKADEEGRRELLTTVFERFVVGQRMIVDVVVKAPYSWLARWGEGIGEPQAESTDMVVA